MWWNATPLFWFFQHHSLLYMNKADMNMIMTTSDFLQFRCTKLNLCWDLRVSHSTRSTVHVHLRLYMIERVRACLTHHRGMDPLSLLSALDHMETDFVQRHQRYIWHTTQFSSCIIPRRNTWKQLSDSAVSFKKGELFYWLLICENAWKVILIINFRNEGWFVSETTTHSSPQNM